MKYFTVDGRRTTDRQTDRQRGEGERKKYRQKDKTDLQLMPSKEYSENIFLSFFLNFITQS